MRNTIETLQPVAVIDRLLTLTRIMEALAFSPRGAFDADCVRMLRAHAQQFQDEGGIGLPDYLVAAAEAQTASSRSSLPEPDVRDDSAVRLMTVHQAKGLEFAIVVLAAMANNIYDPSPAIGIADPNRFEFRITKHLRSVGYDHWDEHVRKPRSAAERVRLHYVACTRARDHLIISLCGEHGTNKRPHSSLLWDAVPRDPSDVAAVDEVPVPVAPIPSPPVSPMPHDWGEQVARIRSRGRVPFIAAPSGDAAAFLGLPIPPVTASRTPPADAPVPFETTVAAETRTARDGRPIGRAVHAALDTIVGTGAGATEADRESACLRAAQDEGVAVEGVAVLVQAAITSSLMRNALSAPRRWSELYRAAPVDSEGVRLVEGFADLVFEGPEGLILVDYKTDESMDDDTRQHYAEQLAAYEMLIERATGTRVTSRRILHLASSGASEFEV